MSSSGEHVMSNLELYQPLLELSVALTQYKEELLQKPNSKRESELKKPFKIWRKKLVKKAKAWSIKP